MSKSRYFIFMRLRSEKYFKTVGNLSGYPSTDDAVPRALSLTMANPGADVMIKFVDLD